MQAQQTGNSSRTTTVTIQPTEQEQPQNLVLRLRTTQVTAQATAVLTQPEPQQEPAPLTNRVRALVTTIRATPAMRAQDEAVVEWEQDFLAYYTDQTRAPRALVFLLSEHIRPLAIEADGTEGQELAKLEEAVYEILKTLISDEETPEEYFNRVRDQFDAQDLYEVELAELEQNLNELRIGIRDIAVNANNQQAALLQEMRTRIETLEQNRQSLTGEAVDRLNDLTGRVNEISRTIGGQGTQVQNLSVRMDQMNQDRKNMIEGFYASKH